MTDGNTPTNEHTATDQGTMASDTSSTSDLASTSERHLQPAPPRPAITTRMDIPPQYPLPDLSVDDAAIVYRSYCDSYHEFYAELAATPPRRRGAAANRELAMAQKAYDEWQAWVDRHERFLTRASETRSEYTLLLERRRDIVRRALLTQAGRVFAARAILQMGTPPC